MIPASESPDQVEISSDLPLLESSRRGYRLDRLEVYNWGNFDSTAGNVHTVPINGETTLLVGHNESGKSTLVDALLTLLVRPRQHAQLQCRSGSGQG